MAAPADGYSAEGTPVTLFVKYSSQPVVLLNVTTGTSIQRIKREFLRTLLADTCCMVRLWSLDRRRRAPRRSPSEHSRVPCYGALAKDLWDEMQQDEGGDGLALVDGLVTRPRSSQELSEHVADLVIEHSRPSSGWWTGQAAAGGRRARADAPPRDLRQRRMGCGRARVAPHPLGTRRGKYM